MKLANANSIFTYITTPRIGGAASMGSMTEFEAIIHSKLCYGFEVQEKTLGRELTEDEKRDSAVSDLDILEETYSFEPLYNKLGLI